MAIEVIKVTDEDITVTLTDVGIRGRAGLVFRGDYSDTTQYYQGDSVRFSNNLYIATGTPEVGTDPTDSSGTVNTGWELLVFGSPDQTAIVDFHVQTSSGSVVFAEGDLIRGLNGNYYWTLGSGTLDSFTDLDVETAFEVRGNPVNTVGNGTISNRPTSGDEIGDFYVTDLGESSIWDGTQWLNVHTRLADGTNNGLMPSVDFTKLSNIEERAERNDKVDVDFSGQVITVTSTEDGVRTNDTTTIPLASSSTEGLVKVDITTLSINGGEISADGTIELGQLQDVTAPTIAETGRVLRGLNDGVTTSYDWVRNNDQAESIRRWDPTGALDYVDQTVGTPAILGLVTGTFNAGANTFTITENADGSWTDMNDQGVATTRTLSEVETIVSNPSTGVAILTENLSSRRPEILGGSSIVEYNERLYIALENTDYETEGTCSISGLSNRTDCESATSGGVSGVWTTTRPDADSNWNEIGPGNLENLDDVDLSVAEGTWTSTDSPILARVGDEWRLFPGLDDLTNIGNVPVPASDEVGYVLRTDGSGSFSWANQVARIQDFSTTDTYIAGDLVRSQNKLWLAVSLNSITPSVVVPIDGTEWQAVGPESLAELQDTSLSTPQQGNILTFDNGAWRNLTANASIASAITLQEIGDVPSNSTANKVLVSTDAVNTETFDILRTYNKEDVVFFSGNYYRYLGTDGATLTQSPNLDTTNWDLTNGDKYEWRDYARDVKNVQAFDVTVDYNDGDLIQVGDSLFIKINGDATAPVAAPTQAEGDTVWKQIGAAALDNISDVDVDATTTEVEWDGINASILALNPSTGNWQKFAGMDDLRNIGNVDDPSVNGSVLGFDSINNKFIWVTSVAAAASVDDWIPTSGYSANALVTHTVDGDLSIFLNILGISANSTGNTTPENDPTHWEIIGPERISNLEDVNITNEDNNDILQYKTDRWVDRTPAQVAATMNLSEIGDVDSPVSSTDNNHVLQVTFSGTTPSYAWVDRTTNTTTIQGYSTTTTYTPGEVIEFQRAIYVAIDDNDSATTNLNQTPGATDSAFWQLIGPETFEHLEDSAISSPSTDQFIIFNGTNWINTDLVTETEKLVDLFDLKDVNGTAAANNVLRFDGNNWVPVTPQVLAQSMLLDDMFNVGEEANVSVGDFLQKVLNTNGVVSFEGVDAPEVGAQIDLENLKNVPNSVAEKSVIQKGSGDDFVASTPNEIAADIDLASIKGIATPITDFVLKSDGSNTYSWVSNVQETATIQTWNNGTTYASGDLVRYQPTGTDDYEVFIARTNAGTNLNQIPNVTGSTFWELLGPESIEELNGLTVTDGANGDLLQRTGTDMWANITPAAMAEAGIAFTDLSDIDDTSIATGDILFRDGNTWQFVSLSTVSNDGTRGIDLSDLKNVAETAEASNGQVLQRTSTGWKYTTLASAASNATTGIKISDLNDVTEPTTGEDGYVLRGNNDGSSVTYDWVHNEEATANIQVYNSSLNYTKGDLVEEDGVLYIAVVTNGPTTSNTTTPSVTSDAVWDIVGPGLLDELNDVTLVGVAAKDLIRRNSANDGWENVTPGVLGADIRIRDLKGVPSVAVPSGILQRDTTGFANNWVIRNPASMADDSTNDNSGIRLQNLRDVNDVAGTDKQLLQVDGSDYAPKDVDDVLGDGTLQSVGNVSSALELNPTASGNDLGKVLTVRSTGDGTTASPYNPSFTWENNTSSTVPGFNTGDATNPQSYSTGDLVRHNSQIWIALTGINSANTGENNSLTNPPGRTLTGGGQQWELVGPETIDTLNDTTIVSPISANLLRYDGSDLKWKNVTPATSADDMILTNVGDVEDAVATDGDFLKRVSGEWKHQATLGNLDTVMDDVKLDSNIAEHNILSRDASGDWVNVKLEDHIENNVDIPLNHLSDVNTSGETAGQVLEFTDSGWVPKSRGFDDITPADETGDTVTLNRFDGRSIRSIATNNGVQTITFATEAVTSADMVLDPQSYNWDLVTPALESAVTANNDVLFQDDFLNTVDSINMATGVNNQTLLGSVHTETSTFLENWSETFDLLPLDPRDGGFGSDITSTVTATLTDQAGANSKTASQDINWLAPTLTANTVQITQSFLNSVSAGQLLSVTVGNTENALANTSLVSLFVNGSDFTSSIGSLSSASDFEYSAGVATNLNTGRLTSTGVWVIRFTEPTAKAGTTETLDLTRSSVVTYTPTFPVLSGFLDQGVTPSVSQVVAFTSTDVNEDGSGFRREYNSVTNNSGKDQTLWFAIRTTAATGTVTFSAHAPGSNALRISNIITGTTRNLQPDSPPAGYAAEGYTLYGIPLVAAGESVIITIS